MHLVAQVAPDRALQLSGTLTQDLGQVLEVITGRNSKFANEVLSSRLQVAILLGGLLLSASEVRIGRDGCGTLESLQSGLGLGLTVGVELALAEELIG